MASASSSFHCTLYSTVTITLNISSMLSAVHSTLYYTMTITLSSTHYLYIELSKCIIIVIIQMADMKGSYGPFEIVHNWQVLLMCQSLEHR